MRLALIPLLASPMLAASLACTPVLFPDEHPIDASCPQIGALMDPADGRMILATMEDLPRRIGSIDFNEMMTRMQFSVTSVLITFLGSNGVLRGELLVNGVPVFDSYITAIGTTFTASLQGLDIQWRANYPGLGSLTFAFGSEGVYRDCENCSPVPEPEQIWTVGLTLAILGSVLFLGSKRIERK